MNAYANALLYAIPAFVVLVLIEIAYGHFVKDQKYRFFDTLSSRGLPLLLVVLKLLQGLSKSLPALRQLTVAQSEASRANYNRVRCM